MNASLPGRRDSIYVLKDGLRYGPYSIDQLQEQLDTAFFGPEQFASFNGSHNWRQIRELVGIAPKSFTVEADQKQNLLVIRYRGHVANKDVERCLEETRTAIPKLKPAFRLLADLTELQEMDLSCGSGIGKIMDLCNECDVETVVRVIPEPKQDIGLNIMSLFHYGGDVRIVTCTSLEEALKTLSK